MRTPARVGLVAVVVVAGGQGGAPGFSVPKDADGEPTEASFVLTLQLAPD